MTQVFAIAARPLAALLSALALGSGCVTVQAQALPASDPPEIGIDADTRVLPVWSNASGRVEALLLLDDTLPGNSALDRLFGADQGTGLGAQVSLGGDTSLRGALQFDADGGLALLCDSVPALTGPLGTLSDRCLLADLGPADPLLQTMTRRASLDAQWRSPEDRIDLSFGLSWIDVDPVSAPAWAAPTDIARFDDAAQFGAMAPWFAGLDQRQLHLDGRVLLGTQSRLLLGSALAESRVRGWDGSAVRWNSAALSVGLGLGDFAGRITGRLIELPGTGSRFNALDIGVSWRTPWRGELSLGARNLLGDGDRDAPRWPLSELPAIEDTEARVPYVRYQQDL